MIEWTDSPWSAQGCEGFAEGQALRLRQAQARHEQRRGSLAWLGRWLARFSGMAHAVSGSDLLQLANEMRDFATHARTPDQRWAPINNPQGQIVVNMIFDDSRWHRVDHAHQVLAALGKTCRSGVLETGMRLKLQLLAPSQPETPITTVVVVGRTSILDGIIEQHNTDPGP